MSLFQDFLNLPIVCITFKNCTVCELNRLYYYYHRPIQVHPYTSRDQVRHHTTLRQLSMPALKFNNMNKQQYEDPSFRNLIYSPETLPNDTIIPEQLPTNLTSNSRYTSSPSPNISSSDNSNNSEKNLEKSSVTSTGEQMFSRRSGRRIKQTATFAAYVNSNKMDYDEDDEAPQPNQPKPPPNKPYGAQVSSLNGQLQIKNQPFSKDSNDKSHRNMQKLDAYTNYQNYKNMNEASGLLTCKSETADYILPVDNESFDDLDRNDASNYDDEDTEGSGSYAADGKKSLPHKKRIAKKLKNKKHNKFYRCTTCDEQFTSAIDLSVHESTHEAANNKVSCNKIDPYECEICLKFFDSQKTFFEHLKVHYEPPTITSNANNHGDIVRGFRCTECSKVYDSYSELENHTMNNHSNAFLCDYCHQKFHTEALLHSHTNSGNCNPDNNSSSILKCISNASHVNQQQQSFSKAQVVRSLKKQQNSQLVECPPSPPEVAMVYQCEFCRARFEHNFELELHLKSHITLETSGVMSLEASEELEEECISVIDADPQPIYRCDKCRQEFVERFDLVRHAKSANCKPAKSGEDSGNRTVFKIEEVKSLNKELQKIAPSHQSKDDEKKNKKLDVSDDLSERILEDHNKVSSFDFALQPKKGSNEKKPKKAMLYKCHLCDRTFLHKNSLNYHIKGHSGD